MGEADTGMNVGQSADAWSTSSFGPPGQIQSRPSESFSNPAVSNSSGAASTNASAGISGSYFREHHPRQRQQLEQSTVQERYQSGAQGPHEEVRTDATGRIPYF